MYSPCKRIKNSEQAWSTLLPIHWISSSSAPQMQRWMFIITMQERPRWNSTPQWPEEVEQIKPLKDLIDPKPGAEYPGIFLWDEDSRQGQVVIWPFNHSLDQEVEEEQVRGPTRHRFKKWKRKRMAWFLPLSNSKLPNWPSSVPRMGYRCARMGSNPKLEIPNWSPLA